jgi:hypothetical protein
MQHLECLLERILVDSATVHAIAEDVQRAGNTHTSKSISVNMIPAATVVNYSALQFHISTGMLTVALIAGHTRSKQ